MKVFLTQETPGKVTALLGAAMVSVFMLFGVSMSNASFAGMENPLPDPFAPQKVVAAIDNMANSYSRFVATVLVAPGKADYALAVDNVKWVIDMNSESVMKLTGLDVYSSMEYYQLKDVNVNALPKVAGAYTEKKPHREFSINALYSLLVE